MIRHLKTSAERVTLWLLLAFIVINAAVPITIMAMSSKASWDGSSSFSPDALLTRCSLRGSSVFIEVSKHVLEAVFALVYSELALCGMWIAIGPGRWLGRTCESLLAAAFLYCSARLPCEGQRIAFASVASSVAMLPLMVLCMGFPAVVARLVTGRHLLAGPSVIGTRAVRNSFGLRDLLLAVAIMAAALALTRVGARELASSVQWSEKRFARGLVALSVWSSVWNFPLLCVLLTFQKRFMSIVRSAALLAPGLIIAAVLIWFEPLAVLGLGVLASPAVVAALALRGAGYRLSSASCAVAAVACDATSS